MITANVGDTVSYEDVANPRRVGTVSDHDPLLGYRIVWNDAPDDVGTWSDLRQAGWHLITRAQDLTDHLQASYDEDQNRYETAWANLGTLAATTVYDGSGCRFIDLGTAVYGLVDYDAGVYRVGIYRQTEDGDDGGVCATFADFPSVEGFIARLVLAQPPAPPAEDPKMTAAREEFRAVVRAFYTAGMHLVDAWEDPDTGFNADEDMPLPARLRPPMSLDEWFPELLRHYGAEGYSEI